MAPSKAAGTASARAEGDPRIDQLGGRSAIATTHRPAFQDGSAPSPLTRFDEDYLSRAGAENLRRWLQEFWRGHFSAQFYIEEKLVPGRGTVFVVRSTLVNGLPPPAAA
jgi:hypothetical protein